MDQSKNIRMDQSKNIRMIKRKKQKQWKKKNDSVEDTEEYEQKDTIDSDDNVISRVQDAIKKKQVDEKFNHVNDFIGEEVSKLTADNPEIERKKLKWQKQEKIPEIQIPEDLGIDEEAIVESKSLNSLQTSRNLFFSYFIPVKGMEDQLCRAYNGVMEHFAKKETAKTGNLIIQGARDVEKQYWLQVLSRFFKREANSQPVKSVKLMPQHLIKRMCSSL